MKSKENDNLPLLELAREKLCANNMASGLPGRESQFETIYNFLFERLKIRHSAKAQRTKVDSGKVANIVNRHLNKSLFICGVPGTGKTATVLRAEHKLRRTKEKTPSLIHDFQSIYINGQHLSSADKLYSEILLKITGKTCQSELAQEKLEKIFHEKDTCQKLIIIDELDMIYNEKKQSVFYSLFDWPTSSESSVLLITIANAMDLPERLMRGRLSSRLGWEKIVFESYTSDCLENILRARLGDNILEKTFDRTAILVATKRIGRTTGDARRILDTCRLAIDQAIKNDSRTVTAAIIDEVGFQNLDIHRRDYVVECPVLELVALKAMLKDAKHVGEENVKVKEVYKQMSGLLKNLEKSDKKNQLYKHWQSYIIGYDELATTLNTLASVGLIYLENDKPLLEKRLYIKDNSDVFRGLIAETPLRLYS